jgi:hypothetical protein
MIKRNFFTAFVFGKSAGSIKLIKRFSMNSGRRTKNKPPDSSVGFLTQTRSTETNNVGGNSGDVKSFKPKMKFGGEEIDPVFNSKVKYLRRHISLLTQYPNQVKFHDIYTRLLENDPQNDQIRLLLKLLNQTLEDSAEIFTHSYLIENVLTLCKHNGVLAPPQFYSKMVKRAIDLLHLRDEVREHLRTLGDLFVFVASYCPELMAHLIDQSHGVLVERSRSMLFDHQARIVHSILISSGPQEKSVEVVAALLENIGSLARLCDTRELRMILEAYLHSEGWPKEIQDALVLVSKKIGKRLADKPLDTSQASPLDWMAIMSWEDRLLKGEDLKDVIEGVRRHLMILKKDFSLLFYEFEKQQLHIWSFLERYEGRLDLSHVRNVLERELSTCYLSAVCHPAVIVQAIHFKERLLQKDVLFSKLELAVLARSIRNLVEFEGCSSEWERVLNEINLLLKGSEKDPAFIPVVKALKLSIDHSRRLN